MLARDIEAVYDFFVSRQPDRDAAAMIAVVGFGHDWKADSLSGAHSLPLRLHQLLSGYGKHQRRKDLVGFFLVTGELHGNVRRAARHRGLNALLVFSVSEL